MFEAYVAVAAAGWLVSLFALVVRPRLRARRVRLAMLDGLTKGDEILTTWGVYGKVLKVDGEVLTLRIAEYAEIRMLKAHVAGKW